MKSRILLLIFTVLTVNSLSVVYGDEVKLLTSAKHATSISEASAVLQLALNDKLLKNELKNNAKNVYKEAKRSKDNTLIYRAYRAYLKAKRQEGKAIQTYEKAKKVKSDLREDLTQKLKDSSQISSAPVAAKIYLEYAFSIEEKYEPKGNVFGYIARFLNLDIEGEIGFGGSENSTNTTSQYAMDDSKSYNISIMARKTLFTW